MNNFIVQHLSLFLSILNLGIGKTQDLGAETRILIKHEGGGVYFRLHSRSTLAYFNFPVCCIFSGCRPVTASNAAASSVSVFTSLLTTVSQQTTLDLFFLKHLARTAQKTPLPTVLLLFRHIAVSRIASRTPLPNYCIGVCYKSVSAIT
jgi:hypothetical protein